MEFSRKREPSVRAAYPLKANVLTEVRYYHPLGEPSMPSLIPAWRVERAMLPSSAVGISHAEVGPGEDTSLVQGGEMLYASFCVHPAQQPAHMQVCVFGSSYPVSALVPSQRLQPSALIRHMK